jgi:hypothetical protein
VFASATLGLQHPVSKFRNPTGFRGVQFDTIYVSCTTETKQSVLRAPAVTAPVSARAVESLQLPNLCVSGQGGRRVMLTLLPKLGMRGCRHNTAGCSSK